MNGKARSLVEVILMVITSVVVLSFSSPEKEYKVFQFPRSMMPRIDGDFDDWNMVPASYAIGLDQLMDTKYGHGDNLDAEDYDVKVKVGWVKGLNRLYFFVEAYDDYWDFEDVALKQDIFEVVVDANLSGGPFVKKSNPNIARLSKEELHFQGHGAHAQNYHIFTPVQNKEWAMVWGNTPWIKEFPYANVAYDHDLKHGESGKFKMEFWITVFDHADVSGYERSVESELKENCFIGLSWCILDYDGAECESFMNLAHESKMVFDATYLNLFRLEPLEAKYLPPLQADWSFVEIDRDKRWIQFKDESVGTIKEWHWNFGDGSFSDSQNPMHIYERGGEWTVVLNVVGSKGESKRSKVWDVVTK